MSDTSDRPNIAAVVYGQARDKAEAERLLRALLAAIDDLDGFRLGPAVYTPQPIGATRPELN